MKIVKGFRDILPYGSTNSDSSYTWTSITNQLRDVMSSYNFQEIITPVAEYDSTFKTGIGEDTDIVSKEMYEFTLDKDNKETSKNQILKYCLRPEGTAPVVRSLIENSLDKIRSVNKLYYLGPMFRYERSQKGRYRMFHQIGAELIGSNEILYEVEILSLAEKLIKTLEIKNFTFQINSIGNKESLDNIRSAILAFGKKNKNSIDEKDYKILEKNPLRFLDKAIHKYAFKDIPKTIDYIDKESMNRFKLLTKLLDDIKFNYKINNQLVRGIDYYNDLVFEATSSDLGAQDALLAGGRYDTLIQKFGGKSNESIGFAAGIERLILAMNKKNKYESSIDFFIIYKEEETIEESLKLALKLRNLGIKVEIDLERRSFTKQIKLADKSRSKKTIIISKNNLDKALVVVKDMNSGEEDSVNIENNLEFLINQLKV
ncbi:histidine--tRNA ligase [bacterium]|nr:histidine--tRNA ligase [bacterium]